MSFVIGKILGLTFRPSTLIPLIGLVGVALIWSRFFRIGRTLVSVALFCFLLVFALPLHQWMQRPLEQRFRQVENPPRSISGIIVLGGAVDTSLTEEYGIPALNDAAERMTTFVMLAHRYPDAKLAFTGGSGSLIAGQLSEADVARSFFEELGLSRMVTYENQSRSTYENATMLRDAFHPQAGEIWILITSAFHMPRAVGTFRAAGWRVLPWPVGYKAHRSALLSLEEGLPERLAELDTASHEWIGLLAYWLSGRTDELVPKPDDVVGEALHTVARDHGEAATDLGSRDNSHPSR